MDRQPSFAEIARRLILYEERVDNGEVQFGGQDLELRSHSTLDHFLSDLERDMPTVRYDDLALITLEFLRQYPSLHTWYEVSVLGRNFEIAFERKEPLVKPAAGIDHAKNVQDWMDLCAWIDPDALITLQFAAKFGRGPYPGELDNWGVYARIWDPAVIGLPMSQRFRDIHTHLSGCESVPLLWQELLAGQRELEQIPAYDHRFSLRGIRAEARANEKRRVAAALETGWGALADRPVVSAAAPSAPRGATLYAPERIRLAATWVQLTKTKRGGYDAVALRVARRLDRYLHAKNLFTRRHIQCPDNNPGLEAFRRQFDLLRPVQPGKSPAVADQNLKRWADFAFDAPGLDHIEFRIAPQRTFHDYVRFFGTLNRVFRHVSDRAPRAGMTGRSMPRFVIHFIRDALQPTRAHEGTDLDDFRHRMDQQCAALHLFLYEQRSRMDHDLDVIRRLIAGIDVANLERNAPIEDFAPYIHRLRRQRNDALTEAYLARRPAAFARWLEAQEMSPRTSSGTPLALTLHVGEDYYHPLIGLREIWNAVIGCNMRSGDRLGHALALGVDMATQGVDMARNTLVPQGRVLDSCVWMLRRIGTLRDVDPRVARDLEDMIDRLSRRVFQRAMLPSTLNEARKMRQYPVHGPGDLNPGGWMVDVFPVLRDEDVRICVECESFDADTRRHRAALVAMPVEFCTPWTVDALTRVQTMVRDIVIRQQVVIEMNPSSNRAVGGIREMRDHPVLRAKVACPELRVAVSCDDPGNFGTRIENEYALAANGLRELGCSNAQTAAIIRDMIDTSRLGAFGRLAFSNDVSDWHAVPGTRGVLHDPESAPD